MFTAFGGKRITMTTAEIREWFETGGYARIVSFDTFVGYCEFNGVRIVDGERKEIDYEKS